MFNLKTGHLSANRPTEIDSVMIFAAGGSSVNTADPFALSAQPLPKPQPKSTAPQSSQTSMKKGTAAPRPNNAKKDPFADLFG